VTGRTGHGTRARGSQDVWIHIITFVLCAATAACGGYRLHNEYNMNVAQTLSILVRRTRTQSGLQPRSAPCASRTFHAAAARICAAPGACECCVWRARSARAPVLRLCAHSAACRDRRWTARTKLPATEAHAALHAYRRGAGWEGMQQGRAAARSRPGHPRRHGARRR
jgi:hypothetical protein